ncbi:MAG: hypothetical protein J5527_01405 [Treponema sp.]|nr:hypothetical protein [Treponema sp.]
MKKLLFFILALFYGLFCYANKYQITEVKYLIIPSEIKFLGVTKPYCLEQKVSVDKNKIFETEEEFTEYLEDYKQRLNNTRVFEELNVEFVCLSVEPKEPVETDEPVDIEDEVMKVRLHVYLKDSFHIFVLPGPKYDSNNGLRLKFKIKDFNFLGTLNTMNSDIYFLIPTIESDNKNTEFGLNFSFDYPFKAGIFDSAWVNDLGISYTIGDSMPEWDVKTGVQFKLPFDKYSFIWEIYQKSINNFDYEKFGDSLYFAEEIKFSLPIKFYESSTLGTFTYTPYLDTYFNWDLDSISENNSSLSSPVIDLGHSISFGRVDWNNNLRDGLDFTLLNYYMYNFQRNMFYPITKVDFRFYNSIPLLDAPVFKRLGINGKIYSFIYMLNPDKNEYIRYDGYSFGDELRGIRDSQNYKDTDISSLTSTSAIIVNLDFPLHIYTTNFTAKFFKFFNFDLQISPFVDIALTYNKYNKSWYNPKDGFYSAGVEFLVYPTKWKGITVRANFGYDIGRKFLKNYLNMDWRGDSSKYEIYLGLGLHY